MIIMSYFDFGMTVFFVMCASLACGMLVGISARKMEERRP